MAISAVSHKFFPPHVFNVSWKVGNGSLGSKNSKDGLPGRQRSLTSLAIWIQYTIVRDRQTDRQADIQTDTGQQQVPCLCIALHGKKNVTYLIFYNFEETSTNVHNCNILHNPGFEQHS